jgi:hypothetical protein
MTVNGGLAVVGGEVGEEEQGEDDEGGVEEEHAVAAG